MANLVKFTREAFLKSGGSFSLFDNTIDPDHGYMVATEGNEERVHFNNMDQKEQIKKLTQIVFKYVADKFDQYFDKDHLYLGLWYDEHDKIWYIDLAENIEDFMQAIDLAVSRKQIAIWDCKNKQSIYTGFKHKTQ